MTTFIEREVEVTTFAQNLIDGLSANTEIYPTSVIPMANLENSLNKYQVAHKQAVAAKVAAEKAFAAKQAALKDLIGQMKFHLCHVEAAVQRNDYKLKLLGWGGTAVVAAVPGVIRELTASRTGSGEVSLSWERPRDGGKVAVYQVEKFDGRKRVWQTVAIALEPEVTLLNQQVGETLEYRVIAINRVGEGSPSNSLLVLS